MGTKKYPRLEVRRDFHERGLPWSVIKVYGPGRYETKVALFHSMRVESCWEHVAYVLAPKKPARRLRRFLTTDEYNE